MKNEVFPVYIGWDSREEIAFEVCKHSLLRRSSIPVYPIPLNVDILRFIGLYDRTFHKKDGVKIDDRDGRPFSTDFAFTRFLSCALNLYQGWVMFQDCDQLWLEDARKLWDLRDDRYAVMCVKHKHEPTESTKMDGQVQQRYARKNWSSVMLFNGAHPANKRLTVAAVNTEPGGWLHGLGWLKDDEIGELPECWNYLESWSSRQIDPAIVHYTRGGPWFPDYRNVEYAEEWREELALLEKDRKPDLVGL